MASVRGICNYVYGHYVYMNWRRFQVGTWSWIISINWLLLTLQIKSEFQIIALFIKCSNCKHISWMLWFDLSFRGLGSILGKDNSKTFVFKLIFDKCIKCNSITSNVAAVWYSTVCVKHLPFWYNVKSVDPIQQLILLLLFWVFLSLKCFQFIFYLRLYKFNVLS